MSIHHLFSYNQSVARYTLFPRPEASSSIDDLDLAIDGQRVLQRTNSGFLTMKSFTMDSPVISAFFARFDALSSECLCVQEESKLVIFHEGDSFGVSLPCSIRSCFACGRCVVLVRDNSGDTSPSSLPVFFSLFHPLEEIRPISFDNFTDLKDGYLTSDFFTSPSLRILCQSGGFLVSFDSSTQTYSLWKSRQQRQTQYLESTVMTGGNMTTMLEVSNPGDNDMITSDLFLSSVWSGALDEPFAEANRYTLLASNEHFYFACQTGARFTLYNLVDSSSRELRSIYATPSISSTLLEVPYYPPIWIILSPAHEFVFYTFSDRPMPQHSLFSPLRSYQTPIKPSASFTMQSPLESDDLVLLSPQSEMSQFLSPLKSFPASCSSKRAVSISNAVENRFNIEFEDHSVERVEFFLTPCNAIISDCLLALHDYLPLYAAYSIRLSFLNYLSRMSKASEWDVWEAFVLSLFGVEMKQIPPSNPWEALRRSAPLPLHDEASDFHLSCSSVWMALHALWESRRIESIDSHCLLVLLFKIAWGCRIVPYMEFYERRIEEVLDLDSQYVRSQQHVDPPYLSPPDIFTTIESRLLQYQTPLPYPAPSDSHVLSGLNHALYLLPLLSPPSPSLVLQYLSEQRISRSMIVSWVSILSLPLLSVLRSIQYEPIAGPASFYDLIDRLDLKLNMVCEEEPWKRSPETSDAALPAQPVSDADPEGVLTAHEFSKSIFPEDCRLEEAGGALLTLSPITLSLQLENATEEHRLELYERSIAKMCSFTMARVYGRAMLTFRTTAPNLSSPFPIPRVPLSGSVTDTGEEVTYLECTDFKREAQYLQGVASGLRLQVPVGSIPRSWILYNKQAHSGNEHAGFLLGLGLREQLNSLSRTDIFEYLSQEDTLLTSSLLIGLSASNKRTGKQMVARMLYLHIPTLSDKTDSSMAIDVEIRVSAILSLGILFMGSCHRFLVEFLLNELPINPKPDTPCPTQSYSFACGASLGLLCLGAASDPERFQKIMDLNIETRCSCWITGFQRPRNGLCYYCPPGLSDTFRTTPGALVALSFIYFDTYNASVLEILTLGNPFQCRPDLYLLSVVCRALVDFSHVCVTSEWIESQYPAVLAPALAALNRSEAGLPAGAPSTLYLAYTTCGVCLVLGLKYLATGDDTVVRFIAEQVRWLQSLPRRSFEFVASLSLVSLSMVLLGTGNLTVLALLSTAPESGSFACQMARSMAVGLLFLGAGSCSVDRSPETVALFLLSVYPLFPSALLDKSFAPSSLRFLWALAARTQLLRARDVDDKEEVQVPFLLRMKNLDPYFGCRLTLVAPALLPPLSLIRSVSVNSPRYFPFEIEENLPFILSRFFTLYVKRKRDSLPYQQDPMGIKRLNKKALWESAVPRVLRSAPEAFKKLYAHLFLSDLTDCLPAVLNLCHFHQSLRCAPDLALASCTRILLHLHTIYPQRLSLLPSSLVRSLDVECLEFFTQLGFFVVAEHSPLYLYYQTHAIPSDLESFTRGSRLPVADAALFRLLFVCFLNYYNFPLPYLLDIRQVDTLTVQLESYPSIRLLLI